MGFEQIPGQEKALSRLRGFLRTGVVPPALLFLGPEGTGKTRAALLFARALNCKRTAERKSAVLASSDSSQGRPDGEASTTELERMQDLTPCAGEEACPSCRMIIAGTHPDVLVVRPEDNHLKIDQVREAIVQVRLRRLAARRRVVIFLKAHTLMLQAANALLKTLEEPPEATTLILVAEGTRGIPVTVLSRCWPIRFSPLPPETLKSAVSFAGLSAEHAERASAYAHGIPGKAARYAEWFKSGEAMKFLGDYWKGVREGASAALSFSDRYGKDKEDFASRLDLLADALNAALVKSLSPAEKSHYPPEVWLGLVESVLNARRFLEVNANRRLLLESLVYEAREAVQSGSKSVRQQDAG